MIESATITAFLEELGSAASTPGGGAAAGISGAQGAALIEMVCNLTRDHESEIKGIATAAKAARSQFLDLAQRDMECFSAVMSAYKAKDGSLQPALIKSAEVPLALIAQCRELVAPLERLASIGNSNLVTDVGIAALLLEGAIRSSRLNVLVNLRSITDSDFKQNATTELEDAGHDVTRLADIAGAIDNDLS